ncbi:MAG: T9SS type A sorting domain-containing protein, partial [Chitinophagales bacterium]
SIQTSDGGYILAGSSYSGISGEKSEICFGEKDIWVIKLNASGAIEWQKTLGGTSSEDDGVIAQTSDGGYFISCNSTSFINGNKTAANLGGRDYWVIKLNSTGVILWQKTYGGSTRDYATCFQETTDGGFILGGHSASGISGNKTEVSYPGGDIGYDVWIVKINATGTIEWQNTINAEGFDYVYSIAQTVDGGYIIGAQTDSEISYDKTEPSSGIDYWVIKLNSTGNIVLWQNDMGGLGTDYIRSIAITPDNGYIIAGYSNSGISGDKTEAQIGDYDFWIIKLAADDCIPHNYYFDFDLDNSGGVDSSLLACEVPVGYIDDALDCNALNSNQGTFEPEVCDGIDNDCDGLIDEGIVDCNPGPAIEWENTIGGNYTDKLNAIKETSDGGYIVGGYSRSGISGDKIEPVNGLDDYWIIKLDNAGNILWQNTIGGSNADFLYSIEQTTDGGYIAGGGSSSGISGDKTENSLGSYDYWILKLDPFGNIVWQNTIGGSGLEYAICTKQTSDGGYIVGGYSYSGLSGDKTEASYGSYDIWVVKLNSSGNIIWQNSIGGNGADGLRSIEQTADGGYILGGESTSGISADKAEASISTDYWVIKLDGSGNITWEKTIKGGASDYLKDLHQTTDGGYILCGFSNSNIGYNKTENSTGGDDYWILKLDATGNIIWQKTIGGIYDESPDRILQISEEQYLIGGISSSGISGDKTENCMIGGAQGIDLWLVKIDDSGNIIWQNSIGGNNEDYLYDLNITTDGGYILGSTTFSDASGDKSENDFDIIDANSDDYWIIKMAPDCFAETCNTLDDNCNGIIDDGITETISISAGGATIFCQGGSVLLTATYSGTSVQWKKNGSNILGATSSTYSVNKSGNYTAVTTSPCGTATSSTITVTVNKNPSASISAGGATTFCAGGSVTLTEAPVGGCTYQWYKGAIAIGGATLTNYIATIAGNYKCRVTKTASGCFKNSNVITVTVPCREGEELIADENSFSIYPNPNDGTFTLSFQSLSGLSTLNGTQEGVHLLQVYNSLGELIHSQNINSISGNVNETISIENLSSGVYFLKMEDNIQNLIIQK